ncbi:ExbD/TolR family protein [Roseivivax sediminis]|uniref:Biopolymer transport protein ExbD n=1 Tax=Roseivivax sediminis TaxID=936889 RepID=A0A1I1ZA01_9RHOB|nr:biopolymer transporter ExbD [Roseivivax sediminis]SFE28519.1 Biopolymer transport protein ExbD [Roseivivax sediminis]
MAVRLDPPVRVRRYRFALTPLADAMFQLLIFFLLTANLSPFSALTLQSLSQAPERAGSGGDVGATPLATAGTLLWTLEAGAIVVRGQRFELSALTRLIGALGPDRGAARIVVIVRDGASVQDLATLLARLRAAGVGTVEVADGGR